jgi:DNA polymerase-3 subunit alpha
MKHRNDFVHLHVHSHYSLLDGVARVGDLVQTARKLAMPALALTDHGNMFGAVEFYQEASKAGVKPIVGYEGYVAPRSRFDREARGIGDAAFHVTLLARNAAGYGNLLKLATSAYLEGFYYRPRVDKEILAEHHEGLVALSGCQKSEINHHLMKDDLDAAAEAAAAYRDIFGKDSFYIELQNNGTEEQVGLVKKALAVAKRTGIPTVATNDIHYLRKQDARAHDVILCVATGKVLEDEQRMRFVANEYYFKTQDDMAARFKELPAALANTVAIAEQCNLELPFGEKHFPVFRPPDDLSAEEYLRKLCVEGLHRHFGDNPPEEARKRLDYEIDVLVKTGFAGYLLIVWDFIRFARERGIPVGPGRGSAVGSLACYTLGITSLDPLRYGLIFERFMQPDRVSDPDIDIDFCMERREEVIEYVREKYGVQNVAQIITFGTLAARAALRDVGRVMNIPLARVDQLAKKVPAQIGIKLKEAIEKEPELKELYESDPEVKDLFDISMKLEGICRHASTHAAGVVIADRPLTDYLPLYKSGDDVTTQYQNSSDQPILDKIGMLKMDFLGLRTLTIIDKCIAMVRQTRGIEVDIETISLDDSPTASMLGRGETKGVFQLESEGMTDLVEKLKPACFEDMIPLVALYRPGPLSSGMVDDFVKRKHGHQKVRYPHAKLEPILKDTYGVILYQEQVMRTAIELAGFSASEADSLRKAMGKKIPEMLKKFRDQFVEGAKQSGVTPKVGVKIFDLMEYFAGYGFNKSHSAAYGLVAYQTAFLKANYPAEFMAALLTCEMQNSDKVVEYIGECSRMEIEVLPPSVNESAADGTPTGPSPPPSTSRGAWTCAAATRRSSRCSSRRGRSTAWGRGARRCTRRWTGWSRPATRPSGTSGRGRRLSSAPSTRTRRSATRSRTCPTSRSGTKPT